MLAVLSLVAAGAVLASAPRNSDWAFYHSDPAGSHFTPLTQINRGNVARLAPVWRHDAGLGGLQTTPLVIGGTLYAYRTDQQIIALDAATGVLRWTFDAGTPTGQPARGLAWWSDGKERRLLAGVKDALYALDPATGRPIPGFGENGKVDLHAGLGEGSGSQLVYLTSPGAVWRDLVITGFRTAENKGAASGAIRAYDVRTGKLRWTFHAIPRDGEPGSETWPVGAWKTAGGANAWAGMVVDEKRGIVFAPTGSAVDDFYGADRKGNNLYANSLLALDAATGKLLWHFQGVHHDIWDRDFPSPPVLVTVRRGGRKVDAVAQTTKHGFLFLFDRVTGKPLFPIEERPFPASTVPGEEASATQPVPVLPAPFARQRLTADMLTDRTPQAREEAVKAFAAMTSTGPFTPLAVDRQTVVFPGFDGGAEWGGSAVDRRGVLYVNANDVAWSAGLVKVEAVQGQPAGARTYEANCAACHGPDRSGSPPDFPSLRGLAARMDAAAVRALLAGGRGRMPAIPLPEAEAAPLIEWLMADGKAAAAGPDSREVVAGDGKSTAPYRFSGYHKFLDSEGYPAVRPPWGTLNAIDLNTGAYLWKIPLGEYPELAAKGLGGTGSENYGGPIVTASGLLFIAATNFDRRIRAFDTATGKVLWHADLPFAGNATPVTYMAGGRQFVVIATSGARNRKGPQGSAYVAFALPVRSERRR